MRVLQLFNRYRERGGEEESAERILRHAGEVCEIDRLWWASQDWDPPHGPNRLGQLRRMFCNEESARDLRARLRSYQPDVLLCHNLYPVGSPCVYREALRAKVPVIQYVHNFRPFSVGGSLWTGSRVAEESLRGRYWAEIRAGAWQRSVLKSAVFALLLKRLHASGWLNAVKCWVCISEFMRLQFLKTGLPANRVAVLRHSWDLEPVAPQGSDAGYYLFLSRLVTEKGVNVLLDAWRILEDAMGEATPLLRIGGTGPEEKRVREAAARTERIEYLGFVSGSEKQDLIASSRAMLAPSIWWEPLGLVTYEAYNNGKPMLAAASGALQETVQDGVTGLLFPPNDARAIVETVIRHEQLTPAKRAAMGAAGREWLIREADPSVWKASFLRLVAKAVEA